MAKLIIEVDLDGTDMPMAGQVHGQLKALVEAVFMKIPPWADLHAVLEKEPDGVIMAEAADEGLKYSVARCTISSDVFDAKLKNTGDDPEVDIAFARAIVKGSGETTVSMHKTIEDARAADHDKKPKNTFYPM